MSLSLCSRPVGYALVASIVHLPQWLTIACRTSFQLIYGRLSDIFGRRVLLASALAFLAVGDLLCGFAQTPIQLYAFRAISGIGGGGITNMSMIGPSFSCIRVKCRS